MPTVVISEVPVKETKAEVISPVIMGLYGAVANSYALLALSHNAHLGVVGCNFQELHELFGAHYEDALSKADLFAERVRALGAQVQFTLSEVEKTAQMPACPPAPFNCEQIIPVLVAAHTKNIADLTALMLLCGAQNDLVTQNMVMNVIESEQKAVWMLKSHNIGT